MGKWRSDFSEPRVAGLADAWQPRRAQKRTHDYERHGTTSLFATLDVATLDVATGEVIGRCHQQHRYLEFLRFLNQIETEVPSVTANYASRKTPKVAKWFKRHQRCHLSCFAMPPPAGQPTGGILPSVGSPASADLILGKVQNCL